MPWQKLYEWHITDVAKKKNILSACHSNVRKFRKNRLGYAYQLCMSETTQCECYNIMLQKKYIPPVKDK